MPIKFPKGLNPFRKKGADKQMEEELKESNQEPENEAEASRPKGQWAVNLSETIGQMENAEHLSFSELREDQAVIIKTADKRDFRFIPAERPKDPTKPIDGWLILPLSMVNEMGFPSTVVGATLGGASYSPSSFVKRAIVAGMREEIAIPQEELFDQPLHPKSEGGRLLLYTPIVVGLQTIPLAEALPPTGLPSGSKIKLKPVDDWPGKKNGKVTEEDLIKTLLQAPTVKGGGIFGRYWINPKTGALYRLGERVGGQGETVWDVIMNAYGHHNKDEDFAGKRLSAFTYWARRLGLEPPEDYLKMLRDKELEFEGASSE